MKSNEFAREYLMEEYLGVLLDEPEKEKDIEQQRVAKLLEKAVPQVEQVETPEQPTVNEPVVVPEAMPQPEAEQPAVTENWQSAAVDEPFQALMFEVAGLTLAVPLTQLGGIHQRTGLNSLIGKPEWFLGVMLHRDDKINVVDTAKWVMPEKQVDTDNHERYQYVVMLGQSHWGLACDKLIDTLDLQPDEIKWRMTPGKRPWLAGLVKEKMCALLDVAGLIKLIEQGLNSNQQ